ncbi:MAG: Ku protein [Gemmataceae bacterium]
MALRSAWEGYLRLNLIAIPVKAYSATISGGGRIGFHLVHAKCNNRIKYKKVCPVHGEVPNDEIVSGYEVAKGQYVLVQPDELKKLKSGGDKAISLDVFIHPEDIDPVYFTDRTYYLTPDGKVGQRPYAVLQRVMAEERRYAVGTMIMSGREQVVLVRSVDRLLAVTVLSYEAQLKKPAAFEDELSDVDVANEELKLARSLVETSTPDHFDFASYQDEYTGRVQDLLEAKAAGKTVPVAAPEEEPAIINLMDALRESLKEAKSSPKTRTAKGKPHKTRAHKSHARRKTG